MIRRSLSLVHTVRRRLCSCQSSSIPVGIELLCRHWKSIHDYQCWGIWPDNLQLPYVQPPTSLCTTSNFLVYNLQLPRITSNFLMVARVIMVATVMVVVVSVVIFMFRTGQDGTGREKRHLNLTFQVTCDLANCPAAFLSYFHCKFVMKYSRRW